jgi:hypothetical protein
MKGAITDRVAQQSYIGLADERCQAITGLLSNGTIELSTNGLDALKLAAHTGPDKQFAVMARYKAAQENSTLSGIHLFSFGGFEESAKWIGDKVQQGASNA